MARRKLKSSADLLCSMAPVLSTLVSPRLVFLNVLLTESYCEIGKETGKIDS
jgi:hypothetical protein